MNKVRLYKVADRGFGYVVLVYDVPEDQTNLYLHAGFCASEKEARYREVARLNAAFEKKLNTVWNCHRQRKLEC